MSYDPPWRVGEADNEFLVSLGHRLSPTPVAVVISGYGIAIVRTPANAAIDPWDLAMTLRALSNAAMARARALDGT